VRKGWVDIVYELLKCETLDINARDIKGVSALHYASEHQDGRILSGILLNANTDVNIEDSGRVFL
jgi:ankyrin repeat protein